MMKFARLWLLAVLFVSMSVTQSFAEEYALGSGDIVSISVYGHEELQVKEMIVRPDGKIAFPLIGEVQAAGLSSQALTNTITTALSEYVKSPKVTINVDKFRTTRIYVLGEVARPGMYEIEKQHNLLDAVGSAGGFTKDAAKKKIFVVHKNQPDHPIRVNLLKLLEKADLSQNISLDDGDVVYLTGSGKINFSRDVLPYISATYQLTRIDD